MGKDQQKLLTFPRKKSENYFYLIKVSVPGSRNQFVIISNKSAKAGHYPRASEQEQQSHL